MNAEDRLSGSLQDAVAIASHPQDIAINMYEAEEAYVVMAPLPGVMADDIDVTLSGRDLRIRAEMRTPAVKPYLLHEWHYGPYERVVKVPDDCSGAVETSFGNGQLAVRVLRR